MSETYEIVRGTALLLTFLAVMALVLMRWLRRSQDDPGRLVTKWIITAFLAPLAFAAIPLFGPIGPLVIVFCAVVLSVLWTPNLVNATLRPFWQALDGGDEEPEPQPLYSIARAKRKRGRYAEALADVRAQLARFPNDVEGQMIAAEILAEDMNDLPGAEMAIQHFLDQSGHPPRHIAFALNTLADWELKYGQDRDAAQRALERLQELCPNTELALVAAQRIAHLTDAAGLVSRREPTRVLLRKGVENVGLLRDSSHLQPAAPDPEKLAAGYTAHLEIHPLDGEVREQLAILYADHYQRLDLAADQLDQLIEQPNQPMKQVAHWLNLLADLQVRHGATTETIQQTLGRIIEKFPGHPVADLARNRLELIRLEIKGKEKSQAVKLGSYEQNIGLKRGLPRKL